MNDAEFLLTGDATQYVSEIFRVEAAYKQARIEARKWASDTKSDAETVSMGLKNAAQNVVQYEGELRRLKQTQKELLALQEGGAGAGVIDAATLSRMKEVEAVTKQMRAERGQARSQEEVEITRITKMAQEAVNAEREAEAIRHAEATEHRRQEELLIDSLVLMSKQEIKELVAAGVVSREIANEALKAAAAMRSFGIAAKGANNAQASFMGVTTQLSFAVNDFLSVSGGWEMRLRAIANNLQMVGLAVGGFWGGMINWGTMAAQAALALGNAMGHSTAEMKKSADQAANNAKAYQDLKDEVDKLTMAEEDYDRVKEKRRLNDLLNAARENVKSAQKEAMGSDETVTGALFRLGRAEDARQRAQVGSTGEFFAATGNLLWQSLRRIPNIGVAPFRGFKMESPEEERARLVHRQAAVDAQQHLAEMDELRRKAMEGFDLKADVKKAEKAIEPSAEGLERIFRRALIDSGPDAAHMQLAGGVHQLLADWPAKVTDKIIEDNEKKFTAKIQGERLAAQFAGKRPEEDAADKVKKELDAARLKVEQARLDANKDLHVTPQERRVIQGLENIADALDMNYKVLKAKADAAKENEKNELMQLPAPKVPPPVVRNGNN
jgi:hypothetical protein